MVDVKELEKKIDGALDAPDLVEWFKNEENEEMVDLKIKISEDFSKHPGPRYESDGINSGEKFREKILKYKYIEAKKKKVKLIVDLDGTSGLPPSFLEEAFGGLQRKFRGHKILDTIKIVCKEEEYLRKDIEGFIKRVTELAR